MCRRADSVLRIDRLEGVENVIRGKLKIELVEDNLLNELGEEIKICTYCM